MSYGYVYVAQIAMGADYNQTMKALIKLKVTTDNLIIAYAPCINHGIKGGLTKAQTEKECGCFWRGISSVSHRLAEESRIHSS